MGSNVRFTLAMFAATPFVGSVRVTIRLRFGSFRRESHVFSAKGSVAINGALQEFTDVIKDDAAGGKIVQKTYSFDQASLALYLPKFSTQAPRLVGVSLHGTTTLTSFDGAGHVLSQTTVSYSKSWGLGSPPGGGHQVIINDYTDLSPA